MTRTLRTLSTILLAALAVTGFTTAARWADAPATRLERRASLADAEDRWFHGDDVSLRYREIGMGEPVILLHGYSDRLEMWSGPADSLARQFRVIVPDLRGFGHSTKSGAVSYYGASMVRDVRKLMDHLGLRRAHLVGYSLGGLLSANLAVDHPSRVRSVTFVAPALWSDSAEFRRDLAPYVAALKDGRGLLPFFEYILPTWRKAQLAEALGQIVPQNDSASLVASLEALPTLAVSADRMRRARVPAMFVVSTVDPVVRHSRAASAWWPGARLVELPTHDHADIHLAPQVLEAVRALAAGGAPPVSSRAASRR